MKKCGRVQLFSLLYSSVTFTIRVGKVMFPLLLFDLQFFNFSILQSFELAMQDSHH